MNEGVKRIYSEMEKLFLKRPTYHEPNNNVLLVLENNVLNRTMRTEDHIKNVISEEKFKMLSIEAMIVLHYMYNSGEVMTTKKASELTERGTTFCRKMLRKLEDKGLLEWHGTSKTDRNQYYVLNF